MEWYLTGRPTPKRMMQWFASADCSVDQFEEFYWADRHAYDEGKLTGLAFWQKFARDAGQSAQRRAIDELNRWDARMWTTSEPRHAGLATAI